MQDNVGTIVIGTKVDTKGLGEGLSEIERLIKKYGGQETLINDKNYVNLLIRLEELNNEYDELEKKQKKFKNNIDGVKVTGAEFLEDDVLQEYDDLEMNITAIREKISDIESAEKERLLDIERQNTALKEQGKLTVNGKTLVKKEPVKSDVEYDFEYIKDYSSQMDALEFEIESLTEEYNQLIAKYGEESEEATKVEAKIEKLINQYQKLEEQQNKIVGSPLKKLSDGFEGLIKKATRLALAVVGIRTIMNLITRSFNILSQYNTEIGNKMENLRLVLAVALEPIIMRIVNWLQTIMAYINYLTTAWFGLDLYARASELTTKKMAEDMESSAGSAKEMRKQLAGFDEMNVLGDNVKGGGGGGAGKIKTPEFNLDPNVEIPEWLKWIKDNGPTIATIIGAIGAALLAVKLAPFIAGIVGATTSMAEFSAGLALIAGGIVLLIGNIANLVFNWDTMDEKQKALSIGLAALGAAMIALGVAMAAGFSAATLGIGAVVAAVIGLIGWIGAAIIKDKEEAQAIQDVNYHQDQYNKKKKESEQALDKFIQASDNAEDAQRKLDEAQQRTGLSGAALNKEILDGTRKYSDLNKEEKEVLKAYRNNETAQKTLQKETKNLTIETFEQNKELNLADKNYKEYGKTLKKAMDDGVISSKKMSKYLVEDMKTLDDASKKTLVENLPKDVKSAFDWNNYGSELNTFKTNWNAYLKELDHSIKVQASLEYKVMTGQKGGTIKGNSIMFAKGGILNIPKLATGAVINRPGAGVPVAGAMAGEAGREGVLPLTDYRAMEMLGREIGKWISINATIPVSVGNRQIARVIEEIGQQSAFAKND